MVKIRIGFDERILKDLDESWVSKMINSRRKDQQHFVIKVVIDTENVNMVLSTPDPGSIGGSRRPNPSEAEIFSIWDSRGLNTDNFTVGDVMFFLHTIRSFA